jgi:hypothetical protein
MSDNYEPGGRCLEEPRPPEPQGDDVVWYRGWEVGFDGMAHDYGGEGWRAYKGGCDLDAPQVSARTYDACLDEIDSEEDD